MARVTAEEYAEKWTRRIKGSTEDIRRGISKVSVSPTEQAAKKAELALQKIIAAFQDGTWAAQLRKVGLEDWKASAIGKGLQRIAAGVDAAAPRQVQMASSLLAAVDASVAEANATPRGDLEANITRMTTFVRGMNKRKLRRPARG
jgi:hypothetical protein